MKIIPRFFHGVADYVTGVFLLLAPNLLGFADLPGAAVWVTRIVGIMILGQAMMTDYELGLIKMIPIAMHLMTDYVVGVLLIAAPWVFGFSGVRVAVMTLTVVGLLVLGMTAMTEPRGRPRKIMA